ncbi:GNAT family N-acetyltransferase [Postechiella marina]|uniref:GNAT family N-acetyltransferase n=1 Tax=Postechiella marina TaxID=943941 RepID=A0ABP8CDW5_9FLAO
MNKDTIVIREIKAEDNLEIEQIIRACFHEFKIPLEGTAYTDPETSKMYEAYQNTNDVYYVVEHEGVVYGGCGFKPLKDFENDVCEIQKMYFSPKVRGLGLGKKMLETCMVSAKEKGFKQCYIESASQLKAALHLYERLGFRYIDGALGNTGHYSCGVWMLKNL